MTRLFPLGALLGLLFELANVYFIMPLPGSQRMRSLELAYALWTWRWAVRAVVVALMLAGLPAQWRSTRRRWLVVLPLLLLVAGVSGFINLRMAADQMFRQPSVVRLASAAENTVALDRLVVGVEVAGEARAYPLQIIGYHHHLRDRIGEADVLVTYCTVCRTGRVFKPFVQAERLEFRLVGMDHFNAMLEDTRTGSWWRQANGEAVVGPRKGTILDEIPSRQVTLRQWLALYPDSRILQPDPAFVAQYAKDYAYEKGTSRSTLTGTDARSWEEKSWVVGISIGGRSRAYDWNYLREHRVINDVLNGTPLVLALASDSASFFAFVRPDTATRFAVEGDSLVAGTRRYAFNGKGSAGVLTPLVASQEFWHSWRTFQPGTDQYPAPNITIARAALSHLFLSRERAQALTLWQDPTVSLTLGALRDADAQPRVALDSAVLGLPLATREATVASMEAFFKAHPAGWDAWFIANPANAGLVEVAAPRVRGDDATMVVGRACGEHCRSAWRLTLRRVRHDWVVQQVRVLPVPRS